MTKFSSSGKGDLGKGHPQIVPRRVAPRGHFLTMGVLRKVGALYLFLPLLFLKGVGIGRWSLLSLMATRGR